MLRLPRRLLMVITPLLFMGIVWATPPVPVPPAASQSPPADAARQDPQADLNEARWTLLSGDAADLRRKMSDGSIEAADGPAAMRGLLVRAESLAADAPDDSRVWKLIVSLAGELNDGAKVDAAVAELLRLTPRNVQVGLQWAAYHARTSPEAAMKVIKELREHMPVNLMYLNAWIVTQRQIDPTGIDLMFEGLLANEDTRSQAIAMTHAMQQSDPWASAGMGCRLIEVLPDHEKAIEMAARSYRSANQFARAKALLDGLSPDTLKQPHIAYLYSDCHFAEHEFQTAFELMAAIDQDTIVDRPGLARRLRFLLPGREKVITEWQKEQVIRQQQAGSNPLVELRIDNQPLRIELFEQEAPNTVAAFLALAQRGDYDETPFGQVQTGFRSIGGTVEGLVPYTLPGEATRPDVRSFFSDSIAMYLPHGGRPDSANCEWCLMHFPAPHLNGMRTVFGRVIEGHDVVRAMQQNATLDSVKVIRPPRVPMDPTVIDDAGVRRPLSEVMPGARGTP